MKRNIYRDAVGAIKLNADFNDKTIAKLLGEEQGASMTPEKTGAARKLRLKPILAACLALLLIAGGMSAYAFAEEAKEYREAVAFFSQNKLSTEGLTRSDIKKVYRDITAGKFSYDKTADVITKSVGGYEIFQQQPTPEDIEGLWNYKSSNIHLIITPAKDKEIYRYDFVYKHDEKLGFDVLEKTVFEKYDGESLLWRAELYDLIAQGYAVYKDRVVVFGCNGTQSSSQTRYGRIALINGNGQIVWDNRSGNGYKQEIYDEAICDDKGIMVFGKSGPDYLCFTRYDYDGNMIRHTRKETGNDYGIAEAAKLGDGYLVRMRSYQANEFLLKVDADGAFFDSFTYTSENEKYYITGMLEYNGKVYLSGYSVPTLKEGESTAGGRYDIAAVLNYVFDEEHPRTDISNEELTKHVRDNFTAVLLVCDPLSGVPGEFYSVKGSLGSTLSVDDCDRLVWRVESITDTFLSPLTSSFTVGGACYVYEYTFDENGSIVSQIKTGDVTAFRR